MTELREDFNLSDLVFPAFYGRNAPYSHLIPEEVISARRDIAARHGLTLEEMESCIRSRLVENIEDRANSSNAAELGALLTSEVTGYLSRNNVPAGSDYPFPRANPDEVASEIETAIRSTGRGYKVTHGSRSRNGKQIGVMVEHMTPNSHYYYEFRYEVGLPKLPSRLNVYVTYHPWRTAMLNAITGNNITGNIYEDDELHRKISLYVDYILAIDDYIGSQSAVAQANQ